MAKKVKDNLIAEESKLVRCKVFGHDEVLTDPVSVDYYKLYMNELIRQNKLVGIFNDEGEYVINEKIKKDLVKIEKEIADPNPYFYILYTTYMKKTFEFSLEVEELDNNMASATLYLIERLDGHSQIERLKSFIASVILPFDPAFAEKVRRIFNMVDSINSIDEGKIPTLSVLMQKYLDDVLILEDIDSLGSQIYIIRMLKLLETSGPVGVKIVNDYKKVASKIDVSKKGAYSKLRHLLDKVIFENGGLEKLNKPKEVLLKPLKEYNDAIKKVEKAQENVGKIVGNAKPKKVEEKVAGKSATKPAKKVEKKGGGGAKKGGGDKGGKKDSKKKDDKKDSKKKDDKNKTTTFKPKVMNVDDFVRGLLAPEEPAEKPSPKVTPVRKAPKREEPIKSDIESDDDLDALGDDAMNGLNDRVDEDNTVELNENLNKGARSLGEDINESGDELLEPVKQPFDRGGQTAELHGDPVISDLFIGNSTQKEEEQE